MTWNHFHFHLQAPKCRLMAKHARRGNASCRPASTNLLCSIYIIYGTATALPNYVPAIAAWQREGERERDREKGLCAEIGSQHFMGEFYFATHFYQNTKIMIVSWSILVDVPLHCCIWLGLFMLCCLSLLLGYCKCQGCTEGDSGFGLLQIMKLNKACMKFIWDAVYLL